MQNLEFTYTISPGKKNETTERIDFLDKPMSFEKDEIALRNKFFYQEAFFFKGKSLKNENITDVIWIESNIDKIVNMSATQTQQEKDTVYSSQTYCLNINYRMKDSQNKTYSPLHSGNKDADKIQVPIISYNQPLDDKKNLNPFKKVEFQEPIVGITEKPCLIPFVIW
jgi:hypothetical protein